MEWIMLLWQYRKAILTVALSLLIAGSVFYIKHVFNERDRLEQQIAAVQKELEAVKKQVTLNEDIAHAISRIKIQSNNYISSVENSPKPDRTKPVVFITGGVFKPAVYKTYSSSNGTSSTARSTVRP